MKPTSTSRVLIFAAIAGLVGGTVGSVLLTGISAQASGTTERVRARVLEIVDEAGAVRVRISVSPRPQPVHVAQGREAGQDSVRYVLPSELPSEPKVEVLDVDGSVVWKAPPETRGILLR